MKTKKVELFMDIYPGWQDAPEPYLCAYSSPGMSVKALDAKRIKITVELPIFGGKADTDLETGSVSEEVKEGFKP